MFIHLYDSQTWGFVKDKIEDKDIYVSQKEIDEIISKQMNGFYYKVINENGTTLNSLLEAAPLRLEEQPKQPLDPKEQHLLFEENIEKTSMLIDLDFRLTKIELGL